MLAESKKIRVLLQRAKMLATLRQFFADRSVIEVDCFALSRFATIDPYIDPIELYPEEDVRCFLHTSPEYKMKQLLAMGIGDIYQLSHVFRKKEMSSKHFPEFTMIEWYRHLLSFEELIEETIELIALFIGDHPKEYYTYLEAFSKFGNINKLDKVHFEKLLKDRNIPFNPLWLEQELMHLAWAEIIEPQFTKDHFIVITDFPSSEAALAQIKNTQEGPVAKRFEIYFRGYELANGYLELRCPDEQQARFRMFNHIRKEMGKEDFEVDENFITALKKGLPQCVGVAVGFDRLMMIKENISNIQDVIF